MNFQLVFRSLGRMLWFAVAGAFCMALVGIPQGALAGIVDTIISNRIYLGETESISEMVSGGLFGALIAALDGLRVGELAFTIAGVMLFQHDSNKSFFPTLKKAALFSAIGVVVGGFFSELGAFAHRQVLFSLWPWLESLLQSQLNFTSGVINGFIIGTFYGAIVGARREIARQKLEQKNASLSLAKSEALDTL